MSANTSFTASAARLSSFFAASADPGRGNEFPEPAVEAAAERDRQVVHAGLERFMLATFIKLGTHEILELVDYAIEALFVASAAQGGQLESPGAFLTTTIRNAAVSAVRKQSGELPGLTLYQEDDAIARFVDQSATAADVRAAMRLARSVGDHQCVRVIGLWLTLAETSAVPPTSRDVGEAAGLSHTTVNDIAARFRSYVVKVQESEG